MTMSTYLGGNRAVLLLHYAHFWRRGHLDLQVRGIRYCVLVGNCRRRGRTALFTPTSGVCLDKKIDVFSTLLFNSPSHYVLPRFQDCFLFLESHQQIGAGTNSKAS